MSEPLTLSTAKEKVHIAIEKLLLKDRVLFEKKRSERCIMHKFALYLQEQFPEPDYDVDCEYNREGPQNDPKAIEQIPNKNGFTPDCIVHKRKLEKNYLYIEAKDSADTRDTSIDINRVSAATRIGNKFKKSNKKCEYNVGLLLRFYCTKNPKVSCDWYENGTKIEPTTISSAN